MKKIILSLIVLLLMVTLSGCGSNKDVKSVDETRKELVKETSNLNLEIFWGVLDSNKAQAKQIYEGNMYIVTVRFQNEEENYFEFKEQYNGSLKTLRIYLETKEIAKLENFEEITVLGKLINVTTTPELVDAFIIDPYVEEKTYTDDELADKIEKFGTSGNITWKEGSFPFFIDNRLEFKVINEELFYNELAGKWIGKEYLGGDKSHFDINFSAENEAYVSKDDSEEYKWDYAFSNNKLNFPKSNTSDDYEVRKVSDKLYVLYTSDNKPSWIFYKN